MNQTSRQDQERAAQLLPDDTLNDDENRIDWERKQKQRKRLVEPGHIEEHEDEVDLDALQAKPTKQGKKGKQRKKRRQLIFDEEIGQVIVKRKRKRQNDMDQWFDHDEF